MMSRWRRAVESPSFWDSVLGLACFIFVTSVVLGFLSGKQMSPPYTDATLGPRALSEFMFAVTGAELATPVIERDVHGQIVKVERRVKRLVFVCDPVVYEFDTDTRKVTESAITPEVLRYAYWMREVKKPAPSLDLALGALFGASGTAVYNLRSATSKFSVAWKHASHIQQLQLLASAGISLGSGFAFGYWWSYEPYPRCGESSIKALLKDSLLWERIWSDTNGNKDGASSWSFRWTTSPKPHLAAVFHAKRRLFPRGGDLEALPEKLPLASDGSAYADSKSGGGPFKLDRQGALRRWLTCDIIKAGDTELAWTVFAWTTLNDKYELFGWHEEFDVRADFDRVLKECGAADANWREPSAMREALSSLR